MWGWELVDLMTGVKTSPAEGWIAGSKRRRHRAFIKVVTYIHVHAIMYTLHRHMCINQYCAGNR